MLVMSFHGVPQRTADLGDPYERNAKPRPTCWLRRSTWMTGSGRWLFNRASGALSVLNPTRPKC